MKKGILERMLIKRYGQPYNAIEHGMHAHCWNLHKDDFHTCLYQGMNWRSLNGLRFKSLREIYGSSIGGYLLRHGLRVVNLTEYDIPGIWNIDEFRIQPNVQHAYILDPKIDYFMDQDNYNYYGIKGDDLYEYNSEYEEVTLLGPIEPAIEEVFDNEADVHFEVYKINSG